MCRLKKIVNRSSQFYEDMKAAKEMADQVLVRDLTFGNMDGDNDAIPLNAEICHFDNIHCHRRRRILSSNNSPSRRHNVLPSGESI